MLCITSAQGKCVQYIKTLCSQSRVSSHLLTQQKEKFNKSVHEINIKLINFNKLF